MDLFTTKFRLIKYKSKKSHCKIVEHIKSIEFYDIFFCLVLFYFILFYFKIYVIAFTLDEKGRHEYCAIKCQP